MAVNAGLFIDPPFLPPLFPVTFGSATIPGNGSQSTGGVAGAAVLDAAQSSSTTSSSSSVVSLLDKYGPVVIGLLAGNMVLMAILCVIALVGCTRGAMRSGARTRSVGPTYAPVSFRDKVSTVDDDPEYTVPVRNYSDQ